MVITRIKIKDITRKRPISQHLDQNLTNENFVVLVVLESIHMRIDLSMYTSLPNWFTSTHCVMLGLLLTFAIAHSGGAALRSKAEKLIGARLYRILFALVSLILAVILIVYFFNHRYDGLQLWQVQNVPGIQTLVWVLSAISFVFLYPSTFNLLEVAAISKPEVHLHETGIIRITRHPQMVGQIIWCIAHTLWIGTTFTLLTSFGLVLHHLFAVWHGRSPFAFSLW